MPVLSLTETRVYCMRWVDHVCCGKKEKRKDNLINMHNSERLSDNWPHFDDHQLRAWPMSLPVVVLSRLPSANLSVVHTLRKTFTRFRKRFAIVSNQLIDQSIICDPILPFNTICRRTSDWANLTRSAVSFWQYLFADWYVHWLKHFPLCGWSAR